MYLKNLTVHGFKSFADKISLDFQPGVTAVVGPNGCGKSNVSDSIRWALGEQSAKALRGGEMADVIFSGTDKRKPSGLANVTLTLSDVDQDHIEALGIKLDFNEVTLSRQVDRDGHGEYYINQVKCRLKDIQRFLMGTGLGRSSYSIMEQGNITQALSSKPEERRAIFEEAAGITRFKSQKREAVRKLEHTEQNLIRLNDLVTEVQRQLASLTRQASKARRYKAIFGRLQFLDTQFAKKSFDEGADLIQERAVDWQQAKSEYQALEESLAEWDSEALTLREALEEIEGRLQASQGRFFEISGERERRQNQIHYNEERLAGLESREAQAVQEIQNGSEQIAASQESITELESRIASAESELESRRSSVEALKESLDTIDFELQSSQETFREAQDRRQEIQRELESVLREKNEIELRQKGDVTRLENLRDEKARLLENQASLEEKLQDYAAQVQSARSVMEEDQANRDELDIRIEELKLRLETQREQINTIQQKIANRRSRLEVMQQWDSEGEGLSEATRDLVNQPGGVYSLLANEIEVDPDFVVAVETALGPNMQMVITENQEQALNALEQLRISKKARVRIASYETRRPAMQVFNLDDLLEDFEEVEPASPSERLESGEVIPAIEVVNAPEWAMLILEGLLEDCWIGKNFDIALAAWEENPGSRTLVTTDGQLLNRSGIFYGGSDELSDPASSLLTRKQEIETLTEEIAQTELELESARSEAKEIQDQQSELQDSRREIVERLREEEMRVASLEGEFNVSQNALASMSSQLERTESELERLESALSGGTGQVGELAERAETLETRKQEAVEEVERLDREVEDARSRREEQNSELTELKVQLASEERNLVSMREQLAPILHRIEEIERRIDNANREIEEISSRREQYKQENEGSHTALQALQEQQDQLQGELDACREQKADQEELIAEKDGMMREQRQSAMQLQQRVGALELELERKRMSIQGLVEKIRQRYQINLEEVQTERFILVPKGNELPDIYREFGDPFTKEMDEAYLRPKKKKEEPKQDPSSEEAVEDSKNKAPDSDAESESSSESDVDAPKLTDMNADMSAASGPAANGVGKIVPFKEGEENGEGDEEFSVAASDTQDLSVKTSSAEDNTTPVDSESESVMDEDDDDMVALDDDDDDGEDGSDAASGASSEDEEANLERIQAEEEEAEPQSYPEVDWDLVREIVDTLKTRLDNIGNVNLVAIEEYEETEERFQFLSEQYEDLIEAKREIQEVIAKINTQTEQMFSETFKQIRENFQELFGEIFGGGKADLILVDEDNPLECGIDIVARPPGKKLQSISLLSGGERTMTAVALLFSIYMVRPSPFCVLDELDAPLDESNISRFIKILKRFLNESQFIIITHNKRTMSVADAFYGVTMQEQGVSRIVSVDFKKHEVAQN